MVRSRSVVPTSVVAAHGPRPSRRGGEHLRDVPGLDRASPRETARERRCMRQEPSAPTTRSGCCSASDESLSSAMATDTSGSFMLKRPPNPQQRSHADQSTGLAPLDAIEQRERVVVAAELAQHVARVVVRDSARLRDVHRRQVAVGEKLGQLLRARCHRAGPVRPLRDRRRPRTARARRPGSSWRTTPPARRWRRCRSRSTRRVSCGRPWPLRRRSPSSTPAGRSTSVRRGTSTSHPAARSTFTASTPVSGSKRSTRQVTSNETRTGRP